MTSLLRAWIIYKIICCTIIHGLNEKVVIQEVHSRLSHDSEKRFFQYQSNPLYKVIHSRLSISRKKRSLGSTETTVVSLELPGIEDDNSINLQLQQVDITHPDMIIRVNDQIQNAIIQRDCYFCGCENGTCATVSTCDGLTGIIEHSSGSYQLEEVSESDIEALPGNTLNYVSGIASSNSRKRRGASERTLVMWKLDVNLSEGNKYIPLPEAPPSSDSSDFDEANLLESNLNHREFEILDEDVQHGPRVRRRVKGPYTVEIAVFVDHHHSRYIAKRYPEANIVKKTQDLVLTLMNAVHRMYDTDALGDSRLGIMVKEIDIETEDVKKHQDHDGNIYETLSSFCNWQADKNPRGEAGEWDHALLLSGLDFWNLQKSQNSTVGLAYVGGMCSRRYSCTVNEGTSLGAAYIIAHEMGHNLGMRHDGDPGANCPKNKYLMSPVMSSGAATWSDCSKRALDKHLTKKGSCLKTSRGKTSKSANHHGDSPGERYNADQQCHFMYGSGWAHFNNDQEPFNNVCEEIWCRKGRHLRTPTAPALEGTSCGNKKVCHFGRCMKIKNIDKKKLKKNPDKIKNKIIRDIKKSKKKNEKNKKKAIRDIKKSKKKNKENKKKAKKLGKKGLLEDNVVKKSRKKVAIKRPQNDLKTNNDVSTIMKTKTKTTGNKSKKNKNKKKIRRNENENFITIKQRLKYIKGKGWKVKIIRIKKTPKMKKAWRKKMKEKRENETDEERRIRLEKKKKRAERKKKKKEENKKLKRERKQRQKKRNKKRKEDKARKSKGNMNNKIRKAKSENLNTSKKSDKYVISVPLKNKPAEPKKTCEPEKIKHVPGKGWLVKVNLKCFEKLNSRTSNNVESDLKKKLRRILKKVGRII